MHRWYHVGEERHLTVIALTVQSPGAELIAAKVEITLHGVRTITTPYAIGGITLQFLSKLEEEEILHHDSHHYGCTKRLQQ